jgi:hypothetical protein
MRPTALKFPQQDRFPAVSEPNPNQPPLTSGKTGEKEKILILTYDNPIRLHRLLPNQKVLHSGQPDLEYMLTVRALGIYEMAKSNRQLVINEEFHEDCRTG